MPHFLLALFLFSFYYQIFPEEILIIPRIARWMFFDGILSNGHAYPQFGRINGFVCTLILHLVSFSVQINKVDSTKNLYSNGIVRLWEASNGTCCPKSDVKNLK